MHMKYIKDKANFHYDFGKLNYSDDTGWITLWCNESIIKYYNYWIQRALHVKLNKPLYGAHITVIAGKYEDMREHDCWKKYDGEEIKYYYDHDVKCDNGYYWLHIECPRLTEIRNEFGLSDLPKYYFHLTIGNTKNI